MNNTAYRKGNNTWRKAYGLFNSRMSLVEVKLSIIQPQLSDFHFVKENYVPNKDRDKYIIQLLGINDNQGNEVIPC